jgi:3-hydroxyisobutyrate dehydrogenase
MRVGFVGLDEVGVTLVRKLIAHGANVLTTATDTAFAAGAVACGARLVDSLKTLAAQSDVVVSLLPSFEQVELAYAGRDGLFTGATARTAMVDCSAGSPDFSRELSRRATLMGLRIGDAPVANGSGPSAMNALTFFVGSEAALFADLDPVLSRMGEAVIHCGGPGCGQIVNQCNSLLYAGAMVATSEAMMLGVKLGIAPATLARAINASTGRCWASEANNPWPGVDALARSSHDYSGGESLNKVLGDLSAALDSARDSGQPLVLAPVVQHLFRTMVERGLGHSDMSAIIGIYDDQPRSVARRRPGRRRPEA